MPYTRSHHIYTTIVLLCSFFMSTLALGQQNEELQFNRFQYHHYKWNTFHTDAYHIYYPLGFDSLASRLANDIPGAIALIEHRMSAKLFDVPNVILYPSPDQLYESNIGSSGEQKHTLPTVVLKGSRIVLAYTGSYIELKAQLYEAIVRSIWQVQFEQLYAEQAGVQPIADKIPLWFKEGVIRYFADKWSVSAEDELRRSFRKKRFHNWQEVIAYEPRLSGQAFCYFLNEQYYQLATMQLFTQLKQKKDLARSVRLIAKSPLDSLLNECFEYYNKRFRNQDNPVRLRADTLKVPYKKGITEGVLVSPDKKYVVYTTYFNRKRTIYLYTIANKTTKKIEHYNLPPWIDDYNKDNYPLLHWSGNNTLIVTMPVKGKVQAASYTTNGYKQRTDKVYGVDGITNLVSKGRGEYLLSAYRKGQSDIVHYNSNRIKYTPITNDSSDDNYLADGAMNEPYFLSERKDVDTGAYYQGIYTITDTVTKVIADTIPYSDWDKLTLIDKNRLIATNKRSGQERIVYISNTLKPIPQTLSEYQPYQYLPSTKEISFYESNDDTVTIIQYPIEAWRKQAEVKHTYSPWLTDYKDRAAERAKEDSILNAAKDKNPSFLDGVLVPKDAKERAQQRRDSIKHALLFNPKGVKRYILQLHSAYFTAKVNNDYYINRYQSYKNYQGQFKFPDVGGLTEGGFTDLFENHHFTIAYRLPAGSEGSDFFVKYRNTAKKLDWGLTYFRKVEQLQADPDREWKDEDGNPYPNAAKVKTHYYELELKYPINYYLSAGLTQAFRSDRTIFQATDKYSLQFKDIKALWSISTLSLNYNKLEPTIPLLFKGYTAAIHVDAFTGLSGSNGTVTGTTLKLAHHQPLYRYITLVTRLQAGYSGGTEHVLYNLGGVDNNLTVKVDSNKVFEQDAPYAFQTLITPFRGQLQNTLYGNQYLQLNVDVYFPVFQTLIPIETPLSVINNLQLGVFSDIGTAKETWRSFNDKWVNSMGLTARSTLAGYPIQVTAAWPQNLSNRPVWYFSLSVR